MFDTNTSGSGICLHRDRQEVGQEVGQGGRKGGKAGGVSQVGYTIRSPIMCRYCVDSPLAGTADCAGSGPDNSLQVYTWLVEYSC